MALILAIEPDRRQAAQLTSLIRARVGADLVLAETAEQALHAIGDRVPDLVLVPALLAPQDDATLAGALRVIAAAARIQMLTIPLLAATSRKKQPGGVLAKWRRLRGESPASGGCDPAMFGDQIAAYLAEAAAERAVNESDRAAAAPGEVSIEKAPVHSAGTAPVGEATGIAMIEIGMAQIEAGSTAIEIGPATIEKAVVAGELAPTEGSGNAAAQSGSSLGLPEDLRGEQLSVEEPQSNPTAETASIADVGAPAGGNVEPWVPLSFVEREDLEPPIVETSFSAGGFAAVAAAGKDLPMAVDPISAASTEEFFLTAFHGGERSVGERSVGEPGIYDLQTDDLSMDALAFDEPPIDTPLGHLRAIDAVAHEPVPSPEPIEPWIAPRLWPNLEGIVVEELTIAEPPVTAQGLVVDPLVADVHAAEAFAEEIQGAETVPRVEVAQAIGAELWMPLSSGAQRTWPDLEGTMAEALPRIIAPVLVEPPMVAAKTAVAAATAPAPKPEWLELIESLRRDVERLRGESRRPPSVAAAARNNETRPPAAPVAEPSPSPRIPSVVDIVTKTRKRPGPGKPVQDEWGFFDPDQCGFAALLAKLDEITHLNDGG